MHSIHVLLAFGIAAASADCRYSFRVFGLENPQLPGVYYAGAISSEEATHCEIEVGREEFLDEGNDVFDFDCESGWRAHTTLSDGVTTVFLPARENDDGTAVGGGVVTIPMDFDSIDSGNLIGGLLAFDGDFGC